MDCNTVTNTAKPVLGATLAGAPPAFTGGAIADGLYEATKAEAYMGMATGRRATLVVLDRASTVLWAGEVLDASGAVVSTYRARTAATATGNQLNQTTVCSTGGATIPSMMSYTATAAQLVLAVASGAATLITTYTRKPCP